MAIKYTDEQHRNGIKFRNFVPVKVGDVTVTVRARFGIARRRKYPRLYMPFNGSIMEHFVNRSIERQDLHDRAERAAFKKLALPTVFEALGIPAETKVVWNRYAGCSCPCSPGFVVKNVVHDMGHRVTDVFVEIEHNGAST